MVKVIDYIMSYNNCAAARGYFMTKKMGHDWVTKLARIM